MKLFAAALGTLAIATPNKSSSDTPAVCSIDDLDLTIDSSYLVSEGWKRGKAKKVQNFWNRRIRDQFKSEYTNSRFDRCKDHSPFLCSEFDIQNPKNGDAEEYLRAHFDWAKTIFLRRLGACGSWRRLESKSLKFHNTHAQLPKPVGPACPAKCDHLDFHPYLYDQVIHSQDSLGFTRLPQINKFRLIYIRTMTLMQSYGRNWSEAKCGTDVQYNGRDNEFDCMTICQANTAEALMRFLFSRLRDSQVIKCEDARQKIMIPAIKMYQWMGILGVVNENINKYAISWKESPWVSFVGN